MTFYCFLVLAIISFSKLLICWYVKCHWFCWMDRTLCWCCSRKIHNVQTIFTEIEGTVRVWRCYPGEFRNCCFIFNLSLFIYLIVYLFTFCFQLFSNSDFQCMLPLAFFFFLSFSLFSLLILGYSLLFSSPSSSSGFFLSTFSPSPYPSSGSYNPPSLLLLLLLPFLLSCVSLLLFSVLRIILTVIS